MKSSHEGDRAVHEAPNANPTEIQSTSFVAAVLSDIADMDNAAFRQMLAKATDGAKRGGGGGGKDELRSIIETWERRLPVVEKEIEELDEKELDECKANYERGAVSSDSDSDGTTSSDDGDDDAWVPRSGHAAVADAVATARARRARLRARSPGKAPSPGRKRRHLSAEVGPQSQVRAV